MNRTILAQITLYRDTETNHLGCETAFQTGLALALREDEEMSSRLIPPLVDAYRILTGRSLGAVSFTPGQKPEPFSQP